MLKVTCVYWLGDTEHFRKEMSENGHQFWGATAGWKGRERFYFRTLFGAKIVDTIWFTVCAWTRAWTKIWTLFGLPHVRTPFSIKKKKDLFF